ncbi:hypothetical protein [Arsukibacterium indicum]|uniref:Uncharacterized protein n=1 Tax=Arsukibacterium indicum TaxID=2848612 RepID=A0ABS6MJM1_9GAMM|nr:hypothetical protein [Arsukibacterium indicum]MBV2129021.1 hypothetical protein [Arsukibacterium indicum]
MDIWVAILIAFGGNAALLAMLGFAGKSLINQWLNKSLVEHQIKLSRFSDKQADAIAGTYAFARKFNSRLKEYLEIPDVTGGGSRNARELEVIKSHKEFLDYYEQNQIYLSKKSVQLIDQINSESKNAFNKYLYQVKNAENIPETAKEWLDIEGCVKNELEQLFTELEKEFREIVGNKS